MLGFGFKFGNLARGRRGANWLPLDLSPAGWWDVSDISTLWQDTAGTTPVTADGDTVKRVDDLSGNGYHYIQPTTANAMIYRTNSGQPYLDADGVDDFMYIDDVNAFNWGTTDFAIWLAMRAEANGGNFKVPFAKTRSATGSHFRAFLTGDRDMVLFRGTDAQVSSYSALSVTQDADSVLMWGRDDTHDRYERNGTGDSQAWANAGVGSVSYRPHLFGDGGNAGYYVNGRFYGGAIMDRFLTTDEAALLRTWLGAKMGLTL